MGCCFRNDVPTAEVQWLNVEAGSLHEDDQPVIKISHADRQKVSMMNDGISLAKRPYSPIPVICITPSRVLLAPPFLLRKIRSDEHLSVQELCRNEEYSRLQQVRLRAHIVDAFRFLISTQGFHPE